MPETVQYYTKFKCPHCGARGNLYLPKTSRPKMLPCPSCGADVELPKRLSDTEIQNQNQVAGGIITAIIKVGLGGVGIWFSGALLAVIFSLSSRMRDYVRIPEPTPGVAMTWDTMAQWLLVSAIVLGGVAVFAITLASVNSILQGINGIRFLSGDGEAIKGIVIKLPDNRKDILKARADRAQSQKEKADAELASLGGS